MGLSGLAFGVGVGDLRYRGKPRSAAAAAGDRFEP